jgi:hypothetical protein
MCSCTAFQGCSQLPGICTPSAVPNNMHEGESHIIHAMLCQMVAARASLAGPVWQGRSASYGKLQFRRRAWEASKHMSRTISSHQWCTMTTMKLCVGTSTGNITEVHY